MQAGDQPGATRLNLHHAIVEQSPDAIIYADRKGTIELWNKAAEKLFGYSAAEVLGKSLDVIIPERLRAAHWAGFDRAMETGQAKYVGRVLTTRSAHKNGSKLYVDLGFALVRDESGAITGALATARDCTERYMADVAQRARVTELEKLQLQKNESALAGTRAAARIPAEESATLSVEPVSEHAARNDERIRQYLKEHLVHASHMPDVMKIIFDVKDGNVILSGTVPHRVMKQSIEETAAAAPGVKHVENHLNVPLTAPWPDASSLR